MNDIANWWTTSIIDMEPGRIEIRGHKIEELIGTLSFTQMIWLMVRGTLPEAGQAALLEAALVAAVDHGPQAPAIAAARMAVTCGLELNGAMGTAMHMLDDVHGGAGQQACELMAAIKDQDLPLDQAVSQGLAAWVQEHTPYIPGFGHRFHKTVDPRATRLLALVDEAISQGVVTGEFAAISRAIAQHLHEQKGCPVPLNIDGATAVIFAELGFSAPLARGLFCLSRSVGALAHGWEQIQQGGRNKGPTPPHYRWTYVPEQQK